MAFKSNNIGPESALDRKVHSTPVLQDIDRLAVILASCETVAQVVSDACGERCKMRTQQPSVSS